MSTRAQVQVIEDGKVELTLYHHTDGYPSHMLDCIRNAAQVARGTEFAKIGWAWEAGRAGKVASFLCTAHPGTMEPEAGHALHGDIEYLYRLNVDKACDPKTRYWEAEILSREYDENGFVGPGVKFQKKTHTALVPLK